MLSILWGTDSAALNIRDSSNNYQPKNFQQIVNILCEVGNKSCLFHIMPHLK